MSIYCIDIVLLTLLRWVSKYILDIVWTERALINWVRYQLESNTAAGVESSNESSRFVAWSHYYLLLLYSMVSVVCCLCSSKVDTINNWKYWQWLCLSEVGVYENKSLKTILLAMKSMRTQSACTPLCFRFGLRNVLNCSRAADCIEIITHLAPAHP